jgi:hypothetical protein
MECRAARVDDTGIRLATARNARSEDRRVGHRRQRRDRHPERHGPGCASSACAHAERGQENQVTRRLVIKCDGGFGTRYNALPSDLTMARFFDLEVALVLPPNNVCMADPAELFSKDGPHLDEAALGPREDCLILVHFENAPGQQAGLWICGLQDMNALAAVVGACRRDILFSTSLVPAYFDLGMLGQTMEALALRPEIVAEADAFIARRRLRRFFGLQLRRTDFMADETQDRAIEEMVGKARHHDFFVWPDIPDTEARLARLDNVHIHPKTSDVDKLVDGSCCQDLQDDQGRRLRFNVMRGAESVRQALVDLTLLSRPEPVGNSASTFLKTALLMRAKARKLLRFSATYGQHFYP